METDELKYWIAFNRVPRIGRARFMALERHFGTLEAAWHAGPHDLQAAGIDSRTALRIVSRRATVDPDEEIERLQSAETRALTWHDPEYPPRLKEIYDPVHIDDILRASGLGISTVSGTLAMMELKGVVKQVGGMNYIRLRETEAEYQAV